MDQRCVGLTAREASELAMTSGYVARIVREDGESRLINLDMRKDRLNFVVEKGIVVACEIY